jgi:3',5'-cyclic AMP phosphodiesterase CpdA
MVNLQFYNSDLHYGECFFKDLFTTSLVESLIKQSNPDLIVITGDAVSGYSWNGKEKGFYAKHWRKWTKPMRRLKKPYAYVFGNHDDGADLSRDEILRLDQTHPYSYTLGEEVSNKSNYNLPIYSSDGYNATALLWMFDTMDEGCMGFITSWGCFTDMDWYKAESFKTYDLYGYMPKGLVFFHIPLSEYVEMHNQSPSYGSHNEPVNCPYLNNGLFETMRKVGNIKSTFCGHDHNNDEGGVYKDIELVYGRKTGYGGYGPDFFQRGARVIKLKEGVDDFTYEHYVLQEDMSIAGKEITIKGLVDHQKGCVRV